MIETALKLCTLCVLCAVINRRLRIGWLLAHSHLGLLISAFMRINYPLVYPISSCTIQTVLKPSAWVSAAWSTQNRVVCLTIFVSEKSFSLFLSERKWDSPDSILSLFWSRHWPFEWHYQSPSQMALSGVSLCTYGSSSPESQSVVYMGNLSLLRR